MRFLLKLYFESWIFFLAHFARLFSEPSGPVIWRPHAFKLYVVGNNDFFLPKWYCKSWKFSGSLRSPCLRVFRFPVIWRPHAFKLCVEGNNEIFPKCYRKSWKIRLGGASFCSPPGRHKPSLRHCRPGCWIGPTVKFSHGVAWWMCSISKKIDSSSKIRLYDLLQLLYQDAGLGNTWNSHMVWPDECAVYRKK